MVLSKGGVKSKIRSSASRTRFSSSDRSATSTRSESPAPQMAAQLCGSESMRASAFSLAPKGVPSSKYPRQYHAPSQAWASTVFASWTARVWQVCASLSSSRSASNSAKSLSTQISNQASQTLSPLPPSPTRLKPSFQSPPPISGNPCGPEVAARLMARRQCSSREASVAEATGIERLSVCCRSEEHTSELQSPYDLVCRLLLEKK